MIVYSKSTGLNNAAIGKLETPIKMIIEHESDILTKKGGICDALFNVEKSSRQWILKASTPPMIIHQAYSHLPNQYN